MDESSLRPDDGHSVGDRLESWAEWLDRRPWAVVAALAASYLFFLVIPIRNFILWYDELFTYYIAQAPTLSAFVDDVRNVDLNPPLIYVLVRVSHFLFGVSEISTRVPSAIAFFLASMGLFVFLRRRVGPLWASAAIALFWYGPFFRYATEARPYGLMLAFFALTLISWDSVSTPNRRRALAGIALGNTGMMLSHVLAPFSIMPFCLAELIRNRRERKIDWAVWAALVLPIGWAAAYLPFLQHLQQVTYPPTFQASFQKMIDFYSSILGRNIPAFLIACGAAFLIAALRNREAESTHVLTARDWPLLMAAMLPPVLVNVAMMRSGGPFWDRYGLTTAAMAYVLVVLFIAQESKLNRVAGLSAMLVLIAMHVGRDVRVLIHLSSPQRLDQLKPELPFVANSALTFLAMDHYERPELVARLYYLVDEASALRYAQNNLFEGLPTLKKYFPVRANFASYPDFAAKHKRFLVLGTINQEEDWLLRKLIAEGATVTPMGEFFLPYQDRSVFDVTLPGDSAPPK
jgi:hypothetical protein